MSHPPVAEGVVLVDFDQTISPWGNMFNYAEPLDGVVDFMKMMKSKGYKLGIFTSRLSNIWLKSENQDRKKHKRYIASYCKRYDIPFDFMTAEKVPAVAMFDDKAIRVEDNWREIIKDWE